MKITLNSIAEILTGVTLRKRPASPQQEGKRVFLMQLGDLDTNGNIQVSTLIPAEHQRLFDQFIVKAGDIVFRGRGAGIVAAVMPETKYPVVVASPLIILRPNIKIVDPHYLVWALTNDLTRRYYTEHSRGSNIIGIGKRDLELLEIDLPPMSVQKKIAKLKNLQEKERELLVLYQTTKSRLIEGLIVDAIYKDKAA